VNKIKKVNQNMDTILILKKIATVNLDYCSLCKKNITPTIANRNKKVTGITVAESLLDFC